MTSHAWERISGIEEADGPEWRLHVMRYRIAAGFVAPDDVVVDAACGTGYGRHLLRGMHYVGVDSLWEREQPPSLLERGLTWLSSDLEKPWPHQFDYDVWVGLETIEHLDDPTHYIAAARQAKRWIILSAPIVPTVHFNQHHRRDFHAAELPELVEDERWELFDWVQQADTYGIYVFRHRREEA